MKVYELTKEHRYKYDNQAVEEIPFIVKIALTGRIYTVYFLNGKIAFMKRNSEFWIENNKPVVIWRLLGKSIRLDEDVSEKTL